MILIKKNIKIEFVYQEIKRIFSLWVVDEKLSEKGNPSSYQLSNLIKQYLFLGVKPRLPVYGFSLPGFSVQPSLGRRRSGISGQRTPKNSSISFLAVQKIVLGARLLRISFEIFFKRLKYACIRPASYW